MMLLLFHFNKNNYLKNKIKKNLHRRPAAPPLHPALASFLRFVSSSSPSSQHSLSLIQESKVVRPCVRPKSASKRSGHVFFFIALLTCARRRRKKRAATV